MDTYRFDYETEFESKKSQEAIKRITSYLIGNEFRLLKKVGQDKVLSVYAQKNIVCFFEQTKSFSTHNSIRLQFNEFGSKASEKHINELESILKGLRSN